MTIAQLLSADPGASATSAAMAVWFAECQKGGIDNNIQILEDAAEIGLFEVSNEAIRTSYREIILGILTAHS